METGEILCGRYRIVRWIARGGMGEVFEAADEVLEQTVALKHVGFGGLPPEEAERTRARTLREARLAARLRGHPDVVSVYDVLSDDDGDVWLVLEYLPSRSLAQALDAGQRMDPVAAARIGAAVASALAAAHAGGVLHRDVKPGNVLLGEADGVVKLTDFGISRAQDDAGSRLTATDVVSGTPAYMAREVARGDDPTPASDVYALGATLYRAVEGHPPFGSDTNALRLMYRVATEPLPPPEHAEALEPLLLRLMEPDPATRPDAALAHDLLDQFARRPFAETVGTAVGPGIPAPFGVPGPGAAPTPQAATPQAATPQAASTLHAPGGGPVTAPGRPWWRRPWPLALSALAALLVVAVVATAIVGAADRRAGSSATSAAAPTGSPGQPAVTGTPGDVNLCPLLPPAAFAPFGTASAPAVGNIPAGCRTTVTTPTWNAKVGLYLAVPRTRLPAGSVPSTDDGLAVYRAPQTAEIGNAADCRRTLVLSDGYQIGATINGTGPVPSCPLADAAIDAVARGVTAGGLSYDPTRSAGWSFAHLDACTLLDLADLQRDATGPAAQGEGVAGWECSWTAPASQVTVTYKLDGPTTSNWGSPRTVAGRRAFVESSGQQCEATVFHRPWSSPTSPAELVTATLTEPPRPGTDLCDATLDLAGTAESRMR